VEQEPHHKIVFQNQYVRLIDLQVKAGDTTLTHTHSAASVVVFLSNSTFAIQDVGRSPVVTEVKAGDIVYRAYDEKPVTHTVWEQGSPMFHCMVVELMKQHPGNDTCSILSGPGVKFQWQQKSVSAYALSIPKGGQYHLQKSNCAWFLIDVSGIVRAVSSGGNQPLQAGGFVYFPPQSELEIDGNENAGCVLLALK
jgi:hypothetical protein